MSSGFTDARTVNTPRSGVPDAAHVLDETGDDADAVDRAGQREDA